MLIGVLENNNVTVSSFTIYDRQWVHNRGEIRIAMQDRLRVIGDNYPAGYGSPRNETGRFFGRGEVRLLARWEVGGGSTRGICIEIFVSLLFDKEFEAICGLWLSKLRRNRRFWNDWSGSDESLISRFWERDLMVDLEWYDLICEDNKYRKLKFNCYMFNMILFFFLFINYFKFWKRELIAFSILTDEFLPIAKVEYLSSIQIMNTFKCGFDYYSNFSKKNLKINWNRCILKFSKRKKKIYTHAIPRSK